jgi:hypothetical protein
MGLLVELTSAKLGRKLDNCYLKLLDAQLDNVAKTFNASIGIYLAPPANDLVQPVETTRISLRGRPYTSTQRIRVDIPIDNTEGVRSEWQEKTIVTNPEAWEQVLYDKAEEAFMPVLYDFIKNRPVQGTDLAFNPTNDHKDNSHHATLAKPTDDTADGPVSPGGTDASHPGPNPGHADEPGHQPD